MELSRLALFKSLEEEQINELLTKIVFQKRSYTPQDLIISQGEKCDRLMILKAGEVKAEMTDPRGKSLKIEEMSAPFILAPAFIFGKQNRFPVNIISISKSRFMVIYKPELLKLFQLNDQVLQNFLSMISSRAQFLTEKLRFHSFKSLKSKLAYYLLNEAENLSNFKMRHSQTDLAELFGAARPSVGRAFMQLQKDGIIDVRYKNVSIIDARKLALEVDNT